MRDNGDEGKEIKDCPFRRGKCIEELCALWIGITQERVVLGVKRQTQGGSCVFPALAMIMSNKQPVQMMRLPPNIIKGQG